MRAIVTSILVVVLWNLGGGPAGAQPPITSCALTGVYVVGASSFSGQFTFTPPAPCAAGAVGSVLMQVSTFAEPPSAFAMTLPYTVDAAGRLSIGPGITGAVGGVAETGIANGLIFETDPATVPAGIQFVGVAERVGLVGVAVPRARRGRRARRDPRGPPARSGPRAPPAPPGLPARPGHRVPPPMR